MKPLCPRRKVRYKTKFPQLKKCLTCPRICRSKYGRCGHCAVGIHHHGWKGGRTITRQGYVLIKDPLCSRKRQDGYSLEHLSVMEKRVKRPLHKNEEVHHKNGQRGDNRLANLELWSRNQPPGQRVKDLVKWAKEILERYKNQV